MCVCISVNVFDFVGNIKKKIDVKYLINVRFCDGRNVLFFYFHYPTTVR